MKTYQRLYLTLAITFLAAIATVSASAQTTIPAEDDTWITGTNTKVDFANFGSINLSTLLGGTPDSTVVNFTGVALDQSNIGLADTLLARGQVTVNGDKFSASLSLQGLHLSSNPDITVQTSNGPVGYHLDVTLANQNGGGHLDFTQTSSDGGTYSSTFNVAPIFTFTNTSVPGQTPIVVDCTNQNYSCTFSMSGGGNWLYTSQSGFDPASQGIPTVPSGVHLGSYVTAGRPRYGGIQVGCGGTRAAGYHCNNQDQQDELHGILGQANGHDVQPPNDCASSSNTPPSGTPSHTPSKSAMASTTTTTGTTPVASICATSL